MSVSQNITGANVSSASGTVDYVAETPAATQTGFVNINTNFNLGNITDLGSNNDTVSINWDPTNPNSASVTTQGTLNADGSITGTFNYALTGSYNPRITITDPLYGVFLVNDSINIVADPSLVLNSINRPTQGTEFTAQIATFTDPSYNGVNENATATINWGDNTSTDTVQLTLISGDQFAINDSHTYFNRSLSVITVTVNDNNTSPTVSLTQNESILIANAQLNVSLFNASILDVDNIQGSIEIGSFSDPGSTIVNASNYTVTLTGAFSHVDQVVYNNATDAYDVYATPNLNPAGVQAFTMAVSPFNSANSSSVSGSVDYVNEASGSNLTGFANNSTNYNLGNIRDFGSTNDTVSINWDPSNLNPSSVTTGGTLNPNGTITGTFDYAQAGTYSPIVTISDPIYGNISIYDSIQITAASISSTGTQSVNGVEGTALPSNTIIASFTDSNPAVTQNNLSASIDWFGDGSEISQGTISVNGNDFLVEGSYAYPENGNFSPKVIITDNLDQLTTTIVDASNVHIDDAPISVSGGMNFNITEGRALSAGTIIGQLTDGDTTTSNINDFTITGSWDGNAFATGDVGLTPVQNENGVYNIVLNNSHTYAEYSNNPELLTFNVMDKGGSSGSAMDNIQVNDATISASNVSTLNFIEGQTLAAGTILGQLTDGDTTTSNPSDFSFTGSWGDGNNFAVGDIGLVATGNAGSGTYNIVAENPHTYAEFLPNGGQLTIDVKDAGGSSASITDQVQVSDAQISVTGVNTFSLTEGQALAAGTIIGHLQDANRVTSNINDFTLSGSWGDGNNFAMGDVSLVSLGSGDYNIVTDNAHTYAEFLPNGGQISILVKGRGRILIFSCR